MVSFHSSTPAAIPSTEDAAAILLNIKHESIMFTPQQLQLATPPQQLQLPTVQPPQQMQLPVTQPSQNLQLSHQQQRQVHYVHPPKVDHHIGQLQMQPNQLQVQSNQLQVQPNQLQVQPNQLQVQPNQLQVQPNQLQELQNAPLQEQPPPNLGHQHLFVQDKHETLEAGVEEEEEANDADMTDASLNSTFLEQIINANFEKDKEGSVMIFDEEAANKLFEEEDERNRHH